MEAEANQNRQEAQYAIERLTHYALQQGLIDWWDLDYSRNRLLELFGFDEPFAGEVGEEVLTGPQEPLNVLIDYGVEIGLIPENTDTFRDLLDARIMGLLMPRPSETIAKFRQTAENGGIQAATDEFYKLSVDSNYIRMDRVAQNIYWNQPTSFGDMEITINLSKPEKIRRKSRWRSCFRRRFIRSASSAGKMWVTQGGSTIRPGKICASFRSS